MTSSTPVFPFTDFPNQVAATFREYGWSKAEEVINQAITAIDPDNDYAIKVIPMFEVTENASIADIVFSMRLGKFTVRGRYTIHHLNFPDSCNILPCTLERLPGNEIIAEREHTYYLSGFADIPDVLKSARRVLLDEMLYDLGLSFDASGFIADAMTTKSETNQLDFARIAVVTVLDRQIMDPSDLVSNKDISDELLKLLQKGAESEPSSILSAYGVIMTSVPVRD